MHCGVFFAALGVALAAHVTQPYSAGHESDLFAALVTPSERPGMRPTPAVRAFLSRPATCFMCVALGLALPPTALENGWSAVGQVVAVGLC